MAEPKRTNFKLRAAFMLPALVIIIVIASAAASHLDFTLPATLIPGVAFVACFSLGITELLIKRKRRHRQSE